MKKPLLIIISALCVLSIAAIVVAGDYKGTQSCKDCHSGSLGSYPGYDKFSQTLHTKIHLPPTAETMISDLSKEVDMGTSFANAKVGFKQENGKYYVVFKPVTGDQKEYEIVYTYGTAWKQRYLVKIENSYYMPPVQWNLNGYKDNSTGKWATYNPANWWNADGSLKPLNNAFRAKSWDKNCAGCHVVPSTQLNTVVKNVSGADTSWTYNWAANNNHANIVVGCESCHGAPISGMGKGHVNNLKELSYDRKLEVCGQCHTRGYSKHETYEYPYDEETGKTYPVGEDLMLYYVLKPGLWPDKESSRQHHQQWVDYKNTKHYNPNMGITCVTCHDPHQDLGNPHQTRANFRTIEEGKGCVSCHSGKMAVENGINKHTKHPQSASSCVGCHMSKTATSGKGFDISSHSFAVIAPSKTLQFKDVTTPAKGMPNSCATSCHRNGKGSYGSGSSFGITDATLSDWTEATDLALADSLNKYYQLWYGTTSVVEKAYGTPGYNQISGNYPNPFTTATTINFEVVNAGNVKLEIYSLEGELVNVVMNEFLSYGSYNVIWNGTSNSGFHMPSGTYFATMYIDGKKTGSRMLIKTR